MKTCIDTDSLWIQCQVYIIFKTKLFSFIAIQILIPRITDKFANFRTFQEIDVFLESDNLKVPKLNRNKGSLLVLSFNVLIASHYVYFLQ